jgi:hypothetical protein
MDPFHLLVLLSVTHVIAIYFPQKLPHSAGSWRVSGFVRLTCSAFRNQCLGVISQEVVVIEACSAEGCCWLRLAWVDASCTGESRPEVLLEKKVSTRRTIMATHREHPYRAERWEHGLSQTNLNADTGLNLPLFHPMTESEQDYIIDAFHAFTHSQPRASLLSAASSDGRGSLANGSRPQLETYTTSTQ